MNYNNTVAIVSGAEFIMQEIKQMLVLLRDIDKIECYDYYDAEEYIKKTLPSVVILHATENDKNCLKLLRKLRADDKTKSIPIILYPEYSETDYIVEAFDAGITDILTSPLKDYELVIRVIWAIQKSDAAQTSITKDTFLANLGIIDPESGFYKEDFSLKYLETIISRAKETRQKSCLVLLKILSAIEAKTDKKMLADSLKASLRVNDLIAVKDDETYYIYLSKAKLNGVYSIFERILSKISPITTISASVTEIQDEIFDDIINVLDYALSKSNKSGELCVVSKQDYIDMYNSEEKYKEGISDREKLGIARILGTEKKKGELRLKTHSREQTTEAKEEIEVKNEEPAKTDEQSEQDKINLGLKIMQEKVKEISETDFKKHVEEYTAQDRENIENKEIDERNAILYKQAYAKKLNMIAEPLLKKYAAKFQNDYKLLDANIAVSPFNTFMKFDKDDIKLDFEMAYDGLTKINFKLSITALGSEIESDIFDMEVMEFDYQKLDIILKTMTDEYRNYLSAD